MVVEDAEAEHNNAITLKNRAVNREAILSSGGVLKKYKSGEAVHADKQLSEDDAIGSDFSNLELKQDHYARPCWVCPDGAIYLEGNVILLRLRNLYLT